MENVKLVISKEKFFNNGQIVLNSMGEFSSCVRAAFQREITVTEKTRQEKNVSRKGITADSLNKALRELLKFVEYPEGTAMLGETHVVNGVFFNDSKEGFDFAAFDDEFNFTVLRNQYIGTDGKHNGEEKLVSLYKKKKLKKSAWVSRINASGELYEDVKAEKQSLTVVGELQFGNWALIYRDLFRLMAADTTPGVDFYIYITATGILQEQLSNQIVNYEDAEKIMRENEKMIKVPTWLIGLDMEE